MQIPKLEVIMKMNYETLAALESTSRYFREENEKKKKKKKKNKKCNSHWEIPIYSQQ